MSASSSKPSFWSLNDPNPQQQHAAPLEEAAVDDLGSFCDFDGCADACRVIGGADIICIIWRCICSICSCIIATAFCISTLVLEGLVGDRLDFFLAKDVALFGRRIGIRFVLALDPSVPGLTTRTGEVSGSSSLISSVKSFSMSKPPTPHGRSSRAPTGTSCHGGWKSRMRVEACLALNPKL